MRHEKVGWRIALCAHEATPDDSEVEPHGIEQSLALDTLPRTAASESLGQSLQPLRHLGSGHLQDQHLEGHVGVRPEVLAADVDVRVVALLVEQSEEVVDEGCALLRQSFEEGTPGGLRVGFGRLSHSDHLAIMHLHRFAKHNPREFVGCEACDCAKSHAGCVIHVRMPIASVRDGGP